MKQSEIAVSTGSGIEINLDAAKIIQKKITDKHKKVSKSSTPPLYVKQKMGLDYVEYSYMRDIADKEYPGWSWTILRSAPIGDVFYEVHGRLKWFDEGIWRKGDAVAAHRIQRKQGSTEFVDIGNDIKAANTDCIKKAFNMYLNIADDVYRNIVDDQTLTDEQIEELVAIAIDADRSDVVKQKIQSMEIGQWNYDASINKLRRLAIDESGRPEM